MPKFRILTPAGASFSNSGGGYSFEMEALENLDAEIFECPTTEEGFLAAAGNADAVYAKGMKFSRRMIEALDKCRVMALGTVGVDYVDVAAATEKGIPVTNCPDTFIEEVADHAMMLLLATHRRAIEQDRMVREGRWAEGRPQLLQVPRLLGQTLGFIAFGRVARAVAERAKPFGLRLLAYDPFLDELKIAGSGVEPSSLPDLLKRSDFISMHLPATPEAVGFLKEKHFRQMKPNAIFINTGRGGTVDEPSLIKALQEKWIAGAGLDVLAV
ncbi:MAG: C-terminal binding protein, partial [Hyphomicrobiaceae bacterium]